MATAQITNMAWPERIWVMRPADPRGGFSPEGPSEQYTEEGIHPEREDKPVKRMQFNVLAMMEQGDMTNNILLQPNDIIYVQPNPFAEATIFLEKILMPVNPIFRTIALPATATRSVIIPDTDDDD